MVSIDDLGQSVWGSNHISSHSKTYEMRVCVRIRWDLPHIWNPKSILFSKSSAGNPDKTRPKFVALDVDKLGVVSPRPA